jgi:hypothetical protein
MRVEGSEREKKPVIPDQADSSVSASEGCQTEVNSRSRHEERNSRYTPMHERSCKLRAKVGTLPEGNLSSSNLKLEVQHCQVQNKADPFAFIGDGYQTANNTRSRGEERDGARSQSRGHGWRLRTDVRVPSERGSFLGRQLQSGSFRDK